MQLPFTVDQFLNVFASYNSSVFPIQIIFYIIAAGCIYLLFKKSNRSSKIISVILSFFWLWIGIVYHLIFFSEINKAASIFGILFIFQGILFAYYGILNDILTFGFRGTLFNYTGIAFIVYALAVYPVLGYFLGHQYPYAPTFGLPCPTTIFTFGILLFIDKRLPVPVIIIPFLWSLIGFSAALYLMIMEDFGLVVAGLFGSTLLIYNNRLESKK